MTESKKQSAWRSPWVLAWVGMLVVFISVNAFMIYMAETGSPGLVVDNYYERGEDYENNLLERLAKDHNWKMNIEAPDFVGVDTPARFGFTITTKEGQPGSPDSVVFYAYRPSGKVHDFSVPMQQETAGRYQADISFPLKGIWDIVVAAKFGEEEYQASYRLSAGVR